MQLLARLGVGYAPPCLEGQGHAGALAQPEVVGRVLDGVAELRALVPELVPEVVEEDVARDRQGPDDVDPPVGLAPGVLEDPVADLDEAPVVEREGGVDDALLEGGQGRGQLERGAGRVLALDGTVVQREVAARILKLGEDLGLDAVDEDRGVVGRVGRQGQHRPVLRIEHDDGAGGGDEVLGRRAVVGAPRRLQALAQ